MTTRLTCALSKAGRFAFVVGSVLATRTILVGQRTQDQRWSEAADRFDEWFCLWRDHLLDEKRVEMVNGPSQMAGERPIVQRVEGEYRDYGNNLHALTVNTADIQGVQMVESGVEVARWAVYLMMRGGTALCYLETRDFDEAKKVYDHLRMQP